MGILKGALSGRRYRVEGELPEGWRDTYIEALEANSFREPLSPTRKEPTMGWVQAHNLLDTSFLDVNQWLYNQYALFSLRIDKKVIPSKLFKATLQKRQQHWCTANNRDRCPPGVREEVKEALELEMLKQTLPNVALLECVWNVVDGWLFLHNDSETANDTFRKLFYRTFSLRPVPWSPLDELGDADTALRLVASGASDLREAK